MSEIVRVEVKAPVMAHASEEGEFLGLTETQDEPGGPHYIAAVVRLPSDLGLLRLVHRDRVKLLTPVRP